MVDYIDGTSIVRGTRDDRLLRLMSQTNEAMEVDEGDGEVVVCPVCGEGMRGKGRSLSVCTNGHEFCAFNPCLS